MRAAVAIIAVLAVCLLAGSATAANAKERLTQREAALAVREEIGNQWLQLATMPRAGRAGATSTSIDCTWMTATKQVCDWKARNSARGQLAEGLAVVTDHPGGADARLYAFTCSARASLPCI